ncbi:transcriptional repressor [Helicobacter sp. 16-1353]|uniref:Fur family transcriptional regulator n=1 Tax=Helicobacter sp. 16-1353 TaxID=2004996 RepID=UPI000DCEF9D1|nr:Fur family transcriptional regulator [Helicobacter sp. 16-1353]RAX54630.1 transcriptional repressor [Helicobacter sp. 16-1353]
MELKLNNQEIKKVESLNSVLSKLKQVVSAKKLKTSKQREDILSLIYNSKVHLNSEEIAAIMKKNNKDSSISSVYRILQFLETYGFVTSIDVDKNGKRYEIAAKEHHYHIICLGCGKITEFIDDEIKDKQLQIAHSLQCQLVSDNLRLFVVCNKCQKEQKIY